jgi:hypothetical protein
MLPGQVHGAGRNAEVFVDEVHDAIGEAMGEKGPEIN